jgi:hypothetical protein
LSSGASLLGLSLLIGLALLDIGTALIFGDRAQFRWVGYVSYMEKSTFAFIFTISYLLYLTNSQRTFAAVSVLVTYFLASHLLHAGIMFNALTGTIMFLVLAVASLQFVGMSLWARCIIGGYVSLIAALVVTVVWPDLVASDANSYWRATIWQNNLTALLDTKLVGVGFGIPYMPLTSTNFMQAQINNFDSQSIDVVNVIEVQYFRGQHSSIVNVAYRLGALGAILFLYLNWQGVYRLYKLLHSKYLAMADRRLVFFGLTQFIGALIQITVHVGLESPRFFMIYILSLGLALMLFRTCASKT